MDREPVSLSDSPDGQSNGHEHRAEEWAELMARTVAHLAAQLTITQLRLRALATEIAASGGVTEPAVRTRVQELAETETSLYLRENLGEALADVIDLDALEAEIKGCLYS